MARQNAEELAQILAASLRDPDVRRNVYQAIHSSQVREHKVHFNLFLDALPFSDQDRFSNRSGVSSDSVSKLVNRAVALELYLPVPEHFERWSGDTNVLVGTALFDHELPFIVDLNGARVEVESPDQPPSLPVLAVVPLEGRWGPQTRHQPSFAECQPTPEDDCGAGGGGGGGGGGGSPTPGVAMDFAFIDDDYEGFLMGGPEFEIHTFWTSDAANPNNVQVGQCAGAEAADPGRSGPGSVSQEYVYDHQNLSWYGDVLLVSEAQLATARQVGDRLLYLVVEDDNTPCAIRRDDYEIEDYQATIAGEIPYGRQTLRNSGYSPDPITYALTLLGQAIGQHLLTHADDFVGIMIPEGELLLSYPDANMAIRGEDFTVGRANLYMRP